MLEKIPFNLASYIQTPWALWAGLLGAILGSFFNVCIYRIPMGTFFATTRSHCPNCGKLIPFYDNVPILSYLFLRGKARCCGVKISQQYLWVEVLSAVLFWWIYIKFPFMTSKTGILEYHPATLLRALHAALFLSALLVCSFIDLNQMIIPDVISLPMIALSPLVAWLHPDLTIKSSMFGVLIGFGIFYGIAWIYVLIRKEYGLGMGDVKLLAAIGGWLGVEAILPTVFFGSILGSFVGLVALIFSRKVGLKTALPFGPFLAVGATIHLFWTDLLPQIVGL